MHQKPTIFAIDFGTSNSLLAAAAPGRVFDPVPLDPVASDPTVMRSALYFASLEEATFGAGAVKALVANGFRGRLIRSIKRHLPSRSFTATRVGERNVTIEQLIGVFLRVMRERACRAFDADITRAVLGRPARFSNVAEEDTLAEERLRRAAEFAGFTEVSFCPEPVAAAYDFASDLTEPRTVLVADLGGGTSDFTLVRMGAHGFRPEDVLSVGGVSVAGDAVDGALVRTVVAPELGAKTHYRVPFGSNVMPMPADLIELLCSPADLTLVDRAKVLRRLSDIAGGAVNASEGEKLEKFSVIVEDGVGFDLYESVETAKRKLSEQDAVTLRFEYPGAELDLNVKRGELERSAQSPVQRIVDSLTETLRQGGLAHHEVDILCLTGGTSRMPLIEQALRDALPNASVRRLKSFHSVVHGLARHAERLCSA
jgi:hypothetical chaperone protein